MIDLTAYNLINNLLIYVLILFIVVFILVFRLNFVHNNLENRYRENRNELKKRATHLEEIKEALRKQKYALWSKEGRRILNEINKISNLWKSRREHLKKGFWEKVKDEPDELKKFQEEKWRIEELIRNTKAKYHKREIDEESFREIVKDYQKDLMELNLKIGRIEESRKHP